MPKIVSSFKKLQVTQGLERTLIAKYLKNPRLIILIILLIFMVGIFSFLNIPRVLNPSINIAIVNIVTILPGAGPDDIESLITIPIEDAVSGITHVKTVTSSSQDSVSITSIEFESGTDDEKARSDVQSAVDGVTLPTDAQVPKVQKLDFQNQPVWSFTVTSTEDQASLVRFSKSLKDRLKELPEIKDVTTTGLDETEVQIILKPENIATFNLNSQAILGSIKSAIKAFPAGSVKTGSNNFTLTIDPVVTKVDDIRNLKITAGDSIVSLSDIAQVFEKVKPDQNSSYFASRNQKPQKSVNFNVYKTSASQIEATARKAEIAVTAAIGENSRFQVHSDQNAADFIQDQFSELQRDFLITISLVFITLLIFLGLRQAVVSSFAIPLTFFITFVVMKAFNIEFSFIAFFSLLLSLGLLVDDTIVVISAMTAYYRLGKFTPLQTGLLVWRDFLIAVFTTTLTTVWAFMPLLLSAGIIGEFIKPIPIVVSSTLLASFFVAMFITLPVMVIILKPNIPFRVRIFLTILSLIVAVGIFYLAVPKSSLLLVQILVFLILLFVLNLIRPQIFSKIGKFLGNRFRRVIDQGLISLEPVTERYRKMISSILYFSSARKKAVLAVVVFFIFAMALFPLGLIKNEFFPASDQDYLYVSLELPPGTTLSVTEQETLKVLDELRNTPGLNFANANLGTTFNSMGGFAQSGSNTSLISIILTKTTQRKISSVDIAQNIRDKYAAYTSGKISVSEVTGGPPAGSDLQIKLFGPDLKILDSYAGKIEDYLLKQTGVTSIDKSIKPGTSKIIFVPDQTKLTQNNLSLDQVGFWLRTYASGLKLESFKLPGEKENTDITLRVNSNSEYIQNLSKLMLPTPAGNIPLVSLGALKLEPNPTLITREAGKRTLSVMAGVKKGFNIQDKNKQLEKFAASLNLPSGYSWQTGGVNEENQRSVNSILQAMLLSFLLIIVTMVIQFSSFRDAMIVMLVIPLAVSGVFIMFALTHTPLSFPALIGVLALFGIVVKNSILLVDKINHNKAAGMELQDAIADAASSRIEPIFLTSFATIVGLIPITLSNALWRGLGGAIIAGLTFSGTIMLIFIPVVYYLLFEKSKK